MLPWQVLAHTPPSASGFAMRSLRFNSADSPRLTFTTGVPTSQNVFTWSLWVKRSALGSIQNLLGAGTTHLFGFNASDQLVVTLGSSVTSTAVFRDPSAWYHIVWAQNGTSVTVYVNNVSVATGTATNSAFNVNATAHQIGSANSANHFNGYIADAVHVDGQALTPSSFTQTDATTGQLVPKSNPTQGLTMGTNGFWLSFDDNSNTTSGTLGADDAGGARGAKAGSNDWTPTNFSVAAGAGNDSLFDAPINHADGASSQGQGNFCTLSPVDKDFAHGALSNGNLELSGFYSSDNYMPVRGTIGVSTGKVVFEVTNVLVAGANNNWSGGLTSYTEILTTQYFSTAPASQNQIGFYCPYPAGSAVTKRGNATAETAITGSTWSNGDTIQVLVDLDAGKYWLGRGGSYWNSSNSLTTFNESDPTGTFTPTGGVFFPVVDVATSVNNANRSGAIVNFGQRAFANVPPAGFKALCAQNLPEPTIVKPNLHFDAVAYNLGGVGGNITSLNFSPDLVWIKSRANATGHRLVDAVRGATKSLESNSTAAEATEATGLTAFLSNGFTLGTDADYNPNAAQVAWCWKEGAVPGFDIVAFTTPASGVQTINHNLGAVPAFYMHKGMSGGFTNWTGWHKSMESATNSYINLHTTAGVSTTVGIWGAGFTSTQWQQLTGTATIANTDYIAYLFAEVPGFSRFGSYTGNANADGPFVWCGFRPRFIMIKCSSTTGNWFIYDTARDTYNVAPDRVYPNLADAEGTTSGIDILSNGFKLRTITTDPNAAQTYIFAAFAEAPFKYSRAR